MNILNDFTTDGLTYADLFTCALEVKKRLEAAVKTTHRRNSQSLETDVIGERAVLLFTNDRVLIATAFLSTMLGGPGFVLPYSDSALCLEQCCQELDFRVIAAHENDVLAPPSHQQVCVFENSFFKNIMDSKLCQNSNSKLHLPELGSNFESILKGQLTQQYQKPSLWIYTGGTTGHPKLVSKTPANLLEEAKALRDHFKIDFSDVFLSMAPPYHIYGLLFSVLLPLVSGASVVNHTVFYPGEIGHTASENSANVLVGTPTHYQALNSASITFNSLSLAFSSGAPLDFMTSESFYDNNDVKIIEVYGSTETGGIAYRSQYPIEQCSTTPWIPFAEIQWTIKDEILCVNSPYLSPDLLRNENGFYQTADKVELVDDGFMLLGRVDRIVKVGGKRVDLSLIESIINLYDGIEDSCTFTINAKGGRMEEIVTLVSGNVKINDLKTYLSTKLEVLSLPRRIKLVDKIPITATGKKDIESAIKLFI